MIGRSGRAIEHRGRVPHPSIGRRRREWELRRVVGWATVSVHGHAIHQDGVGGVVPLTERQDVLIVHCGGMNLLETAAEAITVIEVTAVVEVAITVAVLAVVVSLEVASARPIVGLGARVVLTGTLGRTADRVVEERATVHVEEVQVVLVVSLEVLRRRCEN